MNDGHPQIFVSIYQEVDSNSVYICIKIFTTTKLKDIFVYIYKDKSYLRISHL